MTHIFSLILILGFTSCSWKKSPLENQTLKGHEELYSEPDGPKLSKLDEDEKRIIIASTNDLHGHLEPKLIKFSDDHQNENQTIKIGGRGMMEKYFTTLRETYKNVVLVDSGDIFSKAGKIDSTADFYLSQKYDALTVGLRDFNLKVPASIGTNANLFQKFAGNSKVPLLLSNLYELKTARVVEWQGTKSHIIKDVDGVKVGIIGLIPDDIVGQTPVNNRVGLYVENMLQSTLRHARLLRSLGADVIVVLTHQGIDCGSKLAEESKLPVMKVNFEPQRDKICDLKNVLGEFIERLPPQLIDVVVGGRTHTKMANIVNGMVIMGGFPDGKSFNYTELVVNTKEKKIVPTKTQVHQPVFFCHEFFKASNDCFHEDKSVNHKKRIPVSFLGKKLEVKEMAVTQPTPVNLEVKHKTEELSRSLTHFQAELSYTPQSSGETQLFVMSLKGKDLAKILEEEYNHNRKGHWQPSPFLLKDGELTISISGLDLELEKSYRILTDLESIQNNRLLIHQIGKFEAEALMNHSWISQEEDSISSKLAAQKH